MTKKRTVPFGVLISYFLIFYGIWACMQLLVFPAVNNQLIKTVVIKNLIWVLPSLLLIYKFSNKLKISFKEMFTSKIALKQVLPVAALFVFYVLLSDFIHNGSIGISANFGIDDIIVVAFVGITEELVFRGWLLNAAIQIADGNKTKEYAAIGINAVLFLLIHFPIWISQGEFVSNFANFGFVSILILSVVFSVTFLKSKSFMIPVFLHMLWDLLVFMLL